MKNFFRYFVLALSLSIFPLTTAMTCSTSQQRVTYNTLYSVGSAVNTAYAAYLDQVVAGKAQYSPNVAKAYSDFQSTYAVAVQAAQMNTGAVAPQNVIDLANAVYAAIKQFTK